MAFFKNILDCVSSFLADRLEIVELERRAFAPGSRIAPSVPGSHRLLFLKSGTLHYAMEEGSMRLKAGGLLLVPAWIKRGWRVAGKAKVDLAWISFNPLREAAYPNQAFVWQPDDSAREHRAFTLLLKTWKDGSASTADLLLIEGELKAMLGRFAHGSFLTTPLKEKPVVTTPRSTVVREIAMVTAWIDRHCDRLDVLDGAIRFVRSSDHYFRTRFRETTGLTLGRYTTMVRMRRARYLLSSSALAVKEVAWQSGYRDPLHFSRCYHKFWGHAPKQDRR